jgi:hypothetical protein
MSAINSCWGKCDKKWVYTKCMFKVKKNQQSPQTGSMNLMGPKTIPKIWHSSPATIDGRHLICRHKLHIGTPYRGKRFLTRQIPKQPLLLPPVQVVVALSARIFLISQISCLLPHHLNSLGWLELHVEKNRYRVGHFIVKIFDDSPAEAASLKEGDILIEVNGVNIENIHISIKTTYLHVLYMSCVFTLCF